MRCEIFGSKVCKLDQDHKKCKKEKEKLWIHYKPSLFQHIGTHSSLKGKVCIIVVQSNPFSITIYNTTARFKS